MIRTVCFSPTGATEAVTERIAHVLARETAQPVESRSVLTPEDRAEEIAFAPDDLVIAAVPTYAGRVPNKIMPFFRDSLKGNGAAAVAVVTYGNRSADSALLELVRLLEADGFSVVGAGAFVTRHTMSAVLGAGRPDEADLAETDAFAEAVAGKMRTLPPEDRTIRMDGEVAPYYTPLTESGERADFLRARPVVDPVKCTGCGTCRDVCAMGSVTIEDGLPAVTGTCIKCFACVRACPAGAIAFADESLASHIRMLEAVFGPERKENIRIV